MTGFVRSQYANIGAALTAAVVALGLVTVPPERYDSVIARGIATVQFQVALATQLTSLVNAAPHAAAATPNPSPSAVVDQKTPQASAVLATDVLTALAFAIVGGAVWFLLTPVTLPMSLYLGILPPILGGSGNALRTYLWPINLVGDIINSLFSPGTPAAVALTSASAAVGGPKTPDSETVWAQPDAPGLSVSNAGSVSDSSPTKTTALAASDATTNSGDDPFTSVGRVALNVVGALLSPLWYLAFPITQGLGSLYGYIPPFFDPSGIFSAFNTIANFGKWLSFPFRLGEVLFPPSVPEVTPTLSAATVQSIQSDAGATAAPAVAGLAIAAETTRPIATADTSGRGSVQRNAPSTNAAAAATVRADSTPSAPATMTPLETSAAPDVPEPAVMSDLLAVATTTTAADNAPDSPGPVTGSTGPREPTTHAPSRQRGDKTPPTSARASRSAGK